MVMENVSRNVDMILLMIVVRRFMMMRRGVESVGRLVVEVVLVLVKSEMLV